MMPKQLIVVIEGTAAIGPFWKTIVSDCLDKIVRRFCGNEPITSQKSSIPHFELSIVVFNAHGSYSGCLVQRSGWTSDMDIYFQWLSAIPFAGGGFNDVAIAEGLAEALMMFSLPNGSDNQNLEGQRHCILIAASNPYPLPTQVYWPQHQNLENGNSIETQPENHLSDAETLANFFAQFAISLSVICPKQLPKLKEIYNAGKRNPQAADPPVDNVKNPHFLILISENFMEACSCLRRSGVTNLPSNQNPVKADATSISSVSGPPPVPSGPLQMTATGQVAQNSTSASYISAASNLSGSSSLPMSQPSSNIQNVSLSQTLPGMSQGSLPVTQMLQTGMSTNQNMRSGSGAASMPSGSGTMMPTPGISQQGQQGMQSAIVSSSSCVTNIPLNPQASSALQDSTKYVKMWEGDLSGQRQGQPVFISKLEGYRNTTSSETLAANWPATMQIVRLIAEVHMNTKQHAGKGDYLVFRALNQHGFLGQLQEKKLCAVIQLPSHTLLLSVSDKVQKLIGVLFPADMVVIQPQIPNPLQQHQLQAQMQHQQQNPHQQQVQIQQWQNPHPHPPQ